MGQAWVASVSQRVTKLCRKILVAATTAALFSAVTVATERPQNTISIAMDQVSWQVQSDRFQCKLELDLGKHGRLAFIHAAGELTVFHYFPGWPTLNDVRLASMTAPWMPSGHSEWIELNGEGQSFRLTENQSASLLNAMNSGLWTRLMLGHTELTIPTIGWQPVMTIYRACQDSLSPLSIQQARDTVLYYASGQLALTRQQLELLDRLAQYIQLDPQVERVLIDGHTDNVGSAIANLGHARQRANDVRAVLVSAGVNKKLLETRAHGDRYPVSDNRTAEGREQNRRVTIRIFRTEGQD